MQAVTFSSALVGLTPTAGVGGCYILHWQSCTCPLRHSCGSLWLSRSSLHLGWDLSTVSSLSWCTVYSDNDQSEQYLNCWRHCPLSIIHLERLRKNIHLRFIFLLPTASSTIIKKFKFITNKKRDLDDWL